MYTRREIPHTAEEWIPLLDCAPGAKMLIGMAYFPAE